MFKVISLRHQFVRHFIGPPRWSTLWAVVAWGVSGFMAFPSWPSYIDHFGMFPLVMLIVLFVAHREGRHEATREQIQSTRE